MASIPDMLTSLRSKSSAIPPSRLPARISNGSGLQEEQTKQTRQAVSIGASEVATSYQDVYYLHLSDQTSATRIIPGGYLIVSLFYEPVIFVTFFSLFFFFLTAWPRSLRLPRAEGSRCMRTSWIRPHRTPRQYLGHRSSLSRALKAILSQAMPLQRSSR